MTGATWKGGDGITLRQMLINGWDEMGGWGKNKVIHKQFKLQSDEAIGISLESKFKQLIVLIHLSMTRSLLIPI
jgi:hypothetical protein